MKGELVLVYDEVLDNQMSGKGALRWRGPYAIMARRPSGAYVLQELDGAVLKQPVMTSSPRYGKGVLGSQTWPSC